MNQPRERIHALVKEYEAKAFSKFTTDGVTMWTGTGYTMMPEELEDMLKKAYLAGLEDVESADCLVLSPWKHSACQDGKHEICDDCLSRQITNSRLQSILSHISQLKEEIQ